MRRRPGIAGIKATQAERVRGPAALLFPPLPPPLPPPAARLTPHPSCPCRPQMTFTRRATSAPWARRWRRRRRR